jgi:NAD(P)-dependent dehydrogenase (short-subunit alcohol dehydrogenase family)
VSVGGNIVVAGASGAIGRALTRTLRDRPGVQHVYALSRRAPPAPEPGITWLQTDMADPDALHGAVRSVAVQAPRVHGLIICAGVLHDPGTPPLQPEKSLAQLDGEAFLRVMRINALLPLQILGAFTPLLEHADGSVVAALSAMVGSIADNRLGGWYSYRMSKAALNMGLKTAAIEFARRARRNRPAPIVAALHPGTTHSGLSEPFLRHREARSADETATRLVDVIAKLGPADSGGFFNWDGRPLPW